MRPDMKKVLAVILSLVFPFIIAACSHAPVPDYDYSWTEQYRFIAHACGEIDGYYMTNSIDALESNYDKGCRLFEVDLINSTEGTLICWHGWDDTRVEDLMPEEYFGRVLSDEEFNQMLIAGRYHTMTFEDLAQFMADHNDVYIVTDTKSGNEDVVRYRFGQIISIANQTDPSILERIIPQIYNEDMLPIINEMYQWKSIIYTLYMIPDGTLYSDIVDFAVDNGIRVITCPERLFYEDFVTDLASHNIYVFMHTYNDMDEVNQWSERGVYGFYTDTLMCEE